MRNATKTLLRLRTAVFLLAVESVAAASGAAPDGVIERFDNDRSQDGDLIVPEGGRDTVICRYRSLAGNCVRPMLAEPSDCLSVKSSKVGIPIKRRKEK